ncbi:MAG: RsmB/NOP family class I SAM-dependent RNA methyltransferase [Sphingomicrobium sp.]|nr:RsmB/NOP family class I SAM-dependent RNA methyltransferase [Sphingomonadales bacterium]
MPSPDTPDGLPARHAALRILDAVLRKGLTVDAAAQGGRPLAPPDRALALAIAGETLRRLPDIDRLIDSATRLPLADDAKARMVLRLALGQKIGLATPDHALVATALPLVDGGPRRLVHGVLGTLLRRGIPVSDSPHLPATVEERWRAAWGQPVVEAARRAIAARPRLDLTFKVEAAAKAYPDAAPLADRHARLDHSSSVTALPGFDSGEWWVQDLAASLPARLIPRDANNVLDLCAAPGGKTMQLAAAGHQVTALDRSGSRLARLKANLDRTGLTAELITANALDWQSDRQFDGILLDAPCSATGTFRRHPEVLYRARPSIIAESAVVQGRLLDHAATLVAPGGAIVFATCSLEPEEGEEVVASFLKRQPGFAVALPEPGELPEFLAPTGEGFLRVLPGLLEAQGGLDGFFIARLVAPLD